MNKNTITLSAIVVVTMLLSATILAAPAINLSSMNLPGIFNSAFAIGNTHEISMSAESLPNGQYAYKMISHTKNGTPVTGYDSIATIPGPSLVVTEGDTISVTLTNNLPDGGPSVGFSVEGINIGNSAEASADGGTETYSFTAPSGGNTYIYKDNGSDLVGLFGAIIVEKNDGSVQSFVDGTTGKITPAFKDQLHKEFVLFMVGSTFWGQEISSSGVQTSLWTNPMLVVDENSMVRFHVLSIGMGHTFHLHAHRWVEPGTNAIIDTKLMETPQDSHVFTVRAGDQVGPGDWQYHCHIFAHMEAGMHGILRVLATDSTEPETSHPGADPYGVAITGTGSGNGVVTFEITDEPGAWFKSTRSDALSPITKTKSLEVALPGDSVNFIMSDTNTVHTITSLLWPSGAHHMPMDEVDSYRGGGIVQLEDPGLYVFTCKVHPYMFGAVIVDDPATSGLDLGNTVDTLNGINDLPTSSDLATRLLRTFFIANNPTNWQDYNPTTNPSATWHIDYPNVPVQVDAGTVNLKDVLEARYGNDLTLEAISHPATPAVGEIWVDTQFELTAGKTKPGTATAVNGTTWEVSKKIALPQINMDHPHNMWTDQDQTVIYQTEWFSNKLDTFDRETGELRSTMVVGDAPSHVMTRTDNNDIHVALNGEEGVAEIKATTSPTTVNRIIPMQGLGQDPTHPHAHWMSADGKKMVTPNEFTDDTTIYGFDTGQIEAKTHTGSTAIATGMMPDSSKYYVANLLDSTISVMNMTTGAKIKDLNLLEDYNPITGVDTSNFPASLDTSHNGHIVIGALPIQTPVSPDGKYMVTANTLSATITITDTRNDTVVTTLFADPGTHGVQFGAKKDGGYYAYVSNKFSNRMLVVDADPNNDGNLSDASVVGSVLLTSSAATTVMDDTVSGSDGMGGQGILPVPVVYNGWVQNLPSEWKNKLTPEQQNPYP